MNLLNRTFAYDAMANEKSLRPSAAKVSGNISVIFTVYLTGITISILPVIAILAKYHVAKKLVIKKKRRRHMLISYFRKLRKSVFKKINHHLRTKALVCIRFQ